MADELKDLNKEARKLRESYQLTFNALAKEHNKIMLEFTELSKRMRDLSVKFSTMLKFMEDYTK